MLKMRVRLDRRRDVGPGRAAIPVTLMAPSSEPDQRIGCDFGLGAIAVRLPIGDGFTDAP
jgi:hypothetical protein